MFISRSIKCKKTGTSFALILLILAFSYGTFGGCGIDYDTPASLTDTPTSLIEEADLKGWMDAGLVNSSGYNNVVILDVNDDCSPTSAYGTEHLSGSYCATRSGDILATRTEGIGVSTGFMVQNGAGMDALIQRTGIGPNTTIVFVSQKSLTRATMAYFVFRYWGFPKNRLKILDGTMGDWTTVGPNQLSTDAVEPPAKNSGYSVSRNPSFRPDLRISFPEMIDIVDGNVPNTKILDGRDPTSTFCRTPLCGTITGAVSFQYNSKVTDGTGKYFLDTTTITNNFTNPPTIPPDYSGGAGTDSTKYNVVYCNSGLMAVPIFFALDGILGWPAAYYDGSWFQWGQMADNTNATNGKGIDPGSPWITDPNLSTRSVGTTTYNSGSLPFYPNPPLSFDATVNEIEEEDARYMETGSGGGAGGGGAGGC